MLALWYKYSQEVVYVQGYVTNIDDDTVTVIPHDKHRSLMHGSLLVSHKPSSHQVYKDEIPQKKEVYIGQRLLARTFKDGYPIYNTGRIINIMRSRRPWIQVTLDGSDTVWRQRENLRLKVVPNHCDIRNPSRKIEIKRNL